jgi:hypothetical protein
MCQSIILEKSSYILLEENTSLGFRANRLDLQPAAAAAAASAALIQSFMVESPSLTGLVSSRQQEVLTEALFFSGEGKKRGGCVSECCV